MGIKFDIRSVGIFDVVSARLNDGEVFDSAKLKNTIRFLIENDMRNIVIDLGSLEYLYSDTINAFIASNRHMLEVSGRIAILTEHPKVQDILKRAGLDNIMRIYRSEAEMVADSKEILRQTSSYRIDELAKASSHPGVLPAEINEPTPPKTEFDDFRSEIGQRLGNKLENNEVPQYQYGTPPTTFNPPPAPPTPTLGGFSPPAQPAGYGYPPPTPAPETPPNPQYQAGYTPAAPTPPSYPPAGYPVSNFDYPTVQMPAGGYAATPPTPPPESRSTFETGDYTRDRKESPDRQRGPSGRKPPPRRVGGRSEFEARESEREERAPEPVVAAPTRESYPEETTPRSVSPLLEKRSSFAPILFGLIMLLVIGGAGIFLFTRPHTAQTARVTPPPAPVSTAPATPVATPAPAESTSQAAVPAPTPAPPPAPSKAPATPPVEKPAPASKPVARPHAEAPRPRVVEHERPRVHKVPADHLEITSTPPGADVLVNFAKKGVTPLTVALLNNANRIIVKMNGYKRYETTVSRNTKNRELNVNLEPENSSGAAETPSTPAPEASSPPPATTPSFEQPISPPPEIEAQPSPAPAPAPAAVTPAPAPETAASAAETPAPSENAGFAPGNGPEGIIFLSSTPARADIYVDGKPLNQKTPYKLSIPSGQHRIEMSKDGLKASVTQNVNPGRNRALLLMLQ